MDLKTIFKEKFWKELIYRNFTQYEKDMWNKGFNDGWEAHQQSFKLKNPRKQNQIPDDGC